jgi:hypothetical protein
LALVVIACEHKSAPDAGPPVIIDRVPPTPDGGWPDAGAGLELFHNGRDLAGWMKRYWIWYLSGPNRDPGREGDMAFVPLPDGTSPDGGTTYVGAITTQLSSTDHFVLPLIAYYGETYLPDSGKPDDDEADIAPDPDYLPPSMSLTLTIDGVTVVKSPPNDLSLQFYGRQNFTPPIKYALPTSYGATGALWVKGVGLIHTPLSPGKHTIHLTEYNVNQGHGYDNTWTIVVPGAADAGTPDAGLGLELSHGGKDLSAWLKQYSAWNALGSNPDAGREGDLVYLPLPLLQNPDGGILYTGKLTLHLAPSDHFFMPLIAYYGETYQPDSGKPDEVADVESPDIDYRPPALKVALTIDGVTVLKSPPGDLSLLFCPEQPFSPPLRYPSAASYGATGAIWVKGLALIHTPLAVGKHSMHLVESSANQKIAYDNTWTIIVP